MEWVSSGERMLSDEVVEEGAAGAESHFGPPLAATLALL